MTEAILHLRSSGGLYGAEQVILNLSRELNALGCTNEILCFNNTYNSHLELLEEARRNDLSAFSVDCRGVFDRQTVIDIRQHIRSRSVDVLHCHDYKARLFGLFAARGLKVKLVATNHLWTHGSLKLRAYEVIDGILYNGFDKVVAVSELIEKECRPFVLKKDKLTCIPNGIDLRRFALADRQGERRSTRAGLGLKESDIVLGNIARLSVEKDQAMLLRAFKRLTELAGQDTHKLLLVGDGPEEHTLVALARELGVHNKCLFAGVRADIPQILNCLDVYVQSSIREGVPMIILEAMASEAAIVSTRAGGIPHVIEDGEQGRLVEIGDAERLALVLDDLLRNPDERRRLGQQARRAVEAKFSAHVMAERYREVYRSIGR
jgi:glycosyltransferase involved in cell wall biosynthesis